MSSLPPSTGCQCMNPPFHYLNYQTCEVGIDTTNGRFGEVSLDTCKHCGARWLHYLVEDEAFSGSGRWYRGWISEETVQTVTPENALKILQNLEWHFAGGSYFHSAGFKRTGAMLIEP